ncbi:hypothetical protein [Endothiovibrio diazotrophicus]
MLHYIKWASTAATPGSSQGKSRLPEEDRYRNVVLALAPLPAATSNAEVF